MKIKGIKEIRGISDYYFNENNVRLEKIRKHRLQAELKQVKRIIKKLHKEILKMAKKGEFRLYYSCRRYLTSSQIISIEHYFEEMGYFIQIDDYERYIKPSIDIKWGKDVQNEKSSD